MQVVGKQPPIPQSSAWATPLSFPDPDASQSHQPMPPLHPQQLSSTPQRPAVSRHPPPPPPPPPAAAVAAAAAVPPPVSIPPPPPQAQPSQPQPQPQQQPQQPQPPQPQPQSQQQQQQASARSARSAALLSRRSPPLQNIPPPNSHYALVRSESAPLNLLDDTFPTAVPGLSIDDNSPFPPSALPPSKAHKHAQFAHPLPSPSSTINAPSTSTSPQAIRPEIAPSSHPPPRSLSSVELAGIVNSSYPASVSATASTPQSTAKSAKKAANVQPWHKSVFDMIQDDFPRTPSPMFSSLLAARTSGAASAAASSTTQPAEAPLVSHPSSTRSVHPPTHPLSRSVNHPSNAQTGSRERPHPVIDRRSRLASTASLDLDLDRIRLGDRATERLADTTPSHAVPHDDILGTGSTAPPAESPPSRAHHRRSVSVNWAGDLRTLTTELTRSATRPDLSTSPTSALFASLDAPLEAPTSSGQPSRTPSDGATEGHGSQTPSPPAPKPRSALSNSSPLAPPPPQPTTQKAPSHTSQQQYASVQADHLVRNHLEDLVAPSLEDYDYLYEQNEPSMPTPSPTPNHLGGNAGINSSAHIAPFPSQPYATAAQSIGQQQAQTAQHHGNAAASLVSPNPQLGSATSQYANIFPGMGLFPSPFSNTNAAMPAATGMAPMYTESFRDGLAAADSLKNMSLQMAAFITAQQQIYAAQMAQMAAMTGTSGFATNPASFNGALPAAAAAAAAATMGHVAGAGNPHLRSPWDSRDNGSGNHRNTPRGKHQFDQYRGGFGGVGNNQKKLSGMDVHVGHKGRSTRGRRGSRVHEDVGIMGNHKNNDRMGMGSMSLGSGTQDQGHTRSPLLEEFRATSLSIGRGTGSIGDMGVGGSYNAGSVGQLHNGREWQLSEISNHVVEFATDQHGSRFIQQKLESASVEDKEAVLKHALTDTQRLMTDVFGNYVVQKLLDHGGDKAVKAIAQELEGRMLVLSLHMYGCRVVQKALEVLEPGYRAALVRELDGHVLKCIRDQNGNHVIQKCVELVEPESVQFIVDSVQGQAVALAGHSYGCRVVQRILEHGAGNQKAPIMVEIMSCIAELIKDQYGNYVIQHVVEHGTENERAKIMSLVRGEVCQLSQHKFASNVVERCLQFGSLEERQVLIEILIVGDGPATPSPLNHLVRDQFGNYVVQRVLDVALPPQRERVVTILRAQVPAIKKYSYGKHIIARLEDHANSGVGGGFNHGHPPHPSHPSHGAGAPHGHGHGHTHAHAHLLAQQHQAQHSHAHVHSHVAGPVHGHVQAHGHPQHARGMHRGERQGTGAMMTGQDFACYE